MKFAGSKKDSAQWLLRFPEGFVNVTVVPAGMVMMDGAIATLLARFSAGLGELVVVSQVRPMTTVSLTVSPAIVAPPIDTRAGNGTGALAGGTVPCP